MPKELVWTDRYGCYRARLYGEFDLVVNYATKSKSEPEHPDGPFEIFACGMKCKKRARNVEEGKALAARFARKLLMDALAALPEGQ
jgi:hypothetical protein